MNTVEQIAEVNPLLDFSGLPRFADIRPEHVAPALDALLGDARATIERVATATGSPTWDIFVQPLSDALDRLDRAWTQVGHLNAVVNTPELRAAYNEVLPKVTAFYTELGQDERLFARYRALAASPGFAGADPARRRVVDNALRDFRLSGAELPAAPKARFKEIEEELASLSSRFADNLLDATNDFALYVEDASRLAGMPADVVAAARASAQADGKPGWKLTLHMPSLSAGAAIRRRSELARNALSRQCDAGQRIRQSGMGQRRAGRQNPGAASTKPPRCSATTATPKCRWFRRWRARRPR